MSSREQYGRFSSPPFYRHSPPADTAASTSDSFMLGPHTRTQVHHQANPCPSGSSKQSDDMYYIAKYKDMKRKVKEIELNNDRLLLKCLKARKNIQRLRLERAILYERLSIVPVSEPNVSSFAPSQLPGADPFPSDLAQGQERYQQSQFSPGGQARIPGDRSCIRSETAYHPLSQHPQPPIHGVDSHRPPHRPYEDPPPIDYQQPGVPMLGSPHHVTKPSQRRLKLDIPGEIIQAPPPPPNTHNEVCNGGSRTFPFVHEYSSAQESALVPTEYPLEIRFHQYEGYLDSRPVNRSRRDIDRYTERGSKQKRRPPQEIEKDQRRHPGSRSRSPTGHQSPQGTFVFPLQNPFTSSERESRPRPVQGGQRERHLGATKKQPVVHFDDKSQRYEAESKASGTREGDDIDIRHDYQAEGDGRKTRGSPWQLASEKKRFYSQVDQGDHYAGERDERNGHIRTPRGLPRGLARTDDDVYSLPRVREGEVMD